MQPFPHPLTWGLASGAFGTCGVVPCDELEPPEEHTHPSGWPQHGCYRMQKPPRPSGLSYYGNFFSKRLRICAIAPSLGLNTLS